MTEVTMVRATVRESVRTYDGRNIVAELPLAEYAWWREGDRILVERTADAKPAPTVAEIDERNRQYFERLKRAAGAK